MDRVLRSRIFRAARAASVLGGVPLLIATMGESSRADVAASPDITLSLSGVVVEDREVAIDDLMGGIALEGFGGLPDGSEVDAYHEEGDGSVLFSTGTTVSFSGGAVVAGPEDVVKLDAGAYSLEFDGSVAGIPSGTNLDGVSREAGGDLILSFDTTLALSGGGAADDEDLVRYDGVALSLALDLSSLALVPPFGPGLDVDAADARPGGVWAVSFDTTGSAGGVTFDDEDVVLVDPGGPSVTLDFDASTVHASWSGADLDAVMLPEPGPWAGVAAGIALLGWRSRGLRRAGPDRSRCRYRCDS